LLKKEFCEGTYTQQEGTDKSPARWGK